MHGKESDTSATIKLAFKGFTEDCEDCDAKGDAKGG